MNELQVFNNSEFGEIRAVEIDGEPWLIGKDICRLFGDTNHNRTLSRVDDEDKMTVTITDALGRPQKATAINESGLYAVLFAMQPQKANNNGVSDAYPIEVQERIEKLRKFKRWVTHEVLPAIRKTGGYIATDAEMSDDEIMARALLVANATIERRNERIKALETKNTALLAENAAQKQIIADFEPVKQYLDTILSSPRTLTTTQIAADYDLSAKKLNRILHDDGIQRYVNGQWILYSRYMGKGYTKSKTIQITRSDGRPDTVLNTEWTQKGRLLIHEILTSRGIQAVMDRQAA